MEERFELSLDLKTKLQGDRVSSCLVSTAAPMANCAQQHHSVTRRLTNALAITVFDRGSMPGAIRNAPQLLWCSCGRLVVVARSFWWWSVSWLVHVLFWSLLSEPSELAQTQLAWVEPLRVQSELKDMAPCQQISYIAHILQVQPRIRDTVLSPALSTLPSARLRVSDLWLSFHITRHDSLDLNQPFTYTHLFSSPLHYFFARSMLVCISLMSG